MTAVSTKKTLNTRTGAVAIALEIEAHLGQFWVAKIKENGDSYVISVSLKDEALYFEIIVAYDVDGDGMFNAYLQTMGYSCSGKGEEAVVAIKHARQTLQDRIDFLQNLANKINH